MKKLLSILLLITMIASACVFFTSCDKSGLEFKLNSDEQSYTCLGFKDGKEAAEAIIPETYKDLPVTAIADSLQQAIDDSYGMVKQIEFQNAYYRHDIGARALKAGE